MNTPRNVELVGASQGAVPLQSSEVRTSVYLDKKTRQKVSASLTPGAGTPEPDRVFLNLENVRGNADGTVFDVYVGLPDGAGYANHPELLAGSMALFGVRKASLVDGEHGGQGLTFVIEITDIVDQLHLSHTFDVDKLNVVITPAKEVPDSAKITVGRISIYRQGR